jgi:hypothetical protein
VVPPDVCAFLNREGGALSNHLTDLSTTRRHLRRGWLFFDEAPPRAPEPPPAATPLPATWFGSSTPLLLTTHYSLLTTHYSLLTTYCSLLTAHCSLLIAHCSLLIAHCAHYSLLTTHCSLLTRYGSFTPIAQESSPALCGCIRFLRGVGAALEEVSSLRLAVPRGAVLEEHLSGGYNEEDPPNNGWPDTGGKERPSPRLNTPARLLPTAAC